MASLILVSCVLICLRYFEANNLFYLYKKRLNIHGVKTHKTGLFF